MSILFQNIPQMQNRYPDNQWEEILGGCDFSMFLGCNDLTTAEYFSRRSGEITVAVDSIRKNYYTMRMTDYVPEYSESSSIGKRQLLLPDEVLRFPWDMGLLFIRGQKALRVRKMDYTKHPDSRNLKMEKTADHIPEWRKAEEMHKGQDWETETEADQKEMDSVAESVGMEAMQEEETLRPDYEVKKRHPKKMYTSSAIEQTAGSVMKVEDLFSQSNESDAKRKSPS